MGASYLSPEDLQLLEGLPALDSRAANLQRQLAAAAALRGRPMEKHSTPLGTLFGGIGSIIGEAKAAGREADLQRQLDETLAQQGKGQGVGARLKALMEQQRLQAGTQDLEAGAQRMAADKAEMDAKAAELARASNPTGARATMGTALLQRLGAKVPAGATPADFMPLLPLVERANESEQRSKDRAATNALRKQLAGSSPASELTPEALDQLATQFAQTGVLPALGMGKDAAALRMKIANRAAELFSDNNLARSKAAFGADTKSLAGLQKQADAVNAFERTALANLDTFLQTAKGVVDSGSPLFNAPGRKFDEAVAGNPAMSKFSAARQVAVQEISKVLSGQMGNAAVSDSARHEAASLLSPDASLAQLEAAAAILKQDMANRKAAMAAEIGDVRNRIGGGNSPAAAPIPSTSGKVRVRSPEGKTGTIDAAELPDALANGWTRL